MRCSQARVKMFNLMTLDFERMTKYSRGFMFRTGCTWQYAKKEFADNALAYMQEDFIGHNSLPSLQEYYVKLAIQLVEWQKVPL